MTLPVGVPTDGATKQMTVKNIQVNNLVHQYMELISKT